MAAAVHTAPQGGQIKHTEITMQGGDTRQMAVEQVPNVCADHEKLSRYKS